VSRELNLNIEIAMKVMGWSVEDTNGLWIGQKGEPTGYAPWTFAPSQDLNACFEAQAKCTEKVGIPRFQWAMRLTYLRWWDSLDTVEGITYDPEHFYITASAEQRCRAMLAAIEAANQQAGNLATVEPSQSSPPIGEKE
jgi:hypothetical protein